MYSIEQVQRGVARFIEAELLPKMDGKGRWIVTGISTIYLAKLPVMLSSPAIKATGLVSDSGIDAESIINSVRPAARQTPAVIDIPFGGRMTLTEADLDSLLNHIKQA